MSTNPLTFGDVPKAQSSCEIIRRNLSAWKTIQGKTDVTEANTKRPVSPIQKRRGPCIPKFKRNSLDETELAEKNPSAAVQSTSSISSGYCITNEKIRFILEDTKNFNEKIKSFSGTTYDEKEYLDIEDVLFYNLTELVQIHTDNVKLKQQKLDAILVVQETIKQLDQKLEENIEKAIKRIGYNSDIFFTEGKTKTKSAQRNDNITNDEIAKYKRKRLHYQVNKHSTPLPLVDEINKVKSNLKSFGECRTNKKTQMFKNLTQITIPEEKEAAEDDLQLLEQNEPIEVQDSKNSIQVPLRDEINEIKNNLKSLEKNKPNRKSQIFQSLALLQIPEENEAMENSLKPATQKQPKDVEIFENLILLPMNACNIEGQAEKNETCLKHKETTEELKTADIPVQISEINGTCLEHKEPIEELKTAEIPVQIPVVTSSTEIQPDKNENEISVTNNVNLDQIRKFSLVRVLGNPFSFKRSKLRVTNTLKIIQSCLQDAQQQFEFFKSFPKELDSPKGPHVKNDENQSITTIETVPLLQDELRGTNDENVSETHVENKFACTQYETKKYNGKAKENVVEVKSNSKLAIDDNTPIKKISVLLLQIRFLLFITVMKLLQIPYQIIPLLFIVLWLWEIQ